MRVFVDTNLWVYRLDQRDPAKARFIGEWLRSTSQDHEIVVSTQVLIELRSVLTRKLKPALPAADVRIALAALAKFEVVSTDANLVLDAHELGVAEQLSWFDALVVEAAVRSRCQRLYSEDLGAGRRIGELTICNPFVPSGPD